MFWIISAILVIIAIAFIMPAMLKRDHSQDATREQNISIAKEQLADLELRFEQSEIDAENYQNIRDELELALFDDLKKSDTEFSSSSKKSFSFIDTFLVLLLVPLIAVPVYLNLGNLDFTKQLDSKKAAVEVSKASMPLKADGTPDIEKITANLKAEMQNNPTDSKGWYMLGRSYMLLENFPEAAQSFDKSLSLRPDLAETMLSLADALSMANNGQLEGRPRELVKKALMIEPQNVTALWLSGMAASQAAEYPEAISQWQKVLSFLAEKPNEKSAVENLISEAKSRLNPAQKSDLSVSEKQQQVTTAEVNNASIKVSISLADKLKEKASPDDFVFVYAKAVSGPPMPLAAVRKKVKDLPFKIELNDSMAMLPNLKISSFKEVSVGARISKTGQPIPQNGDLYSEKNTMINGDPLTLEIDKIYKK